MQHVGVTELLYYIHGFGGVGGPKERDRLVDLDVDGSMILKWI